MLRTRLLSVGLLALLALQLQACTGRHAELATPQSEHSQSTSEYSLPRVAEAMPATHFQRGTRYAIATQGEASSRAAEEILEAGGNLIDAAVAASFVISVERPQSTGIGGGGFLIYHDAKANETIAFDFRETAPLRAFANMYLNSDGSVNERLSKDGILASGVPGLVAGLYEIHRRYGELNWAQVLEPSIRLAEEGFPIYEHLAEALTDKADLLAANPAAKKIFLRTDGSVLGLGDRLIQKDLAKTLRTIQSRGRAGFYSGWVAAAILDEFASRGGLLEKRDLDTYEVKTRKPVTGNFRGHRIASMPPPSSGGAHVIQILNTLEAAELRNYGPGHPHSIALTAASMQQAFADRATYMGDADFVDVPLQEITSKAYASKVFAKISKNSRRKSEELQPGSFKVEPTETTHLSFMDSEGNAIASTQTINGWFGAGMVIPGTGIVVNNEMDDFAVKVGASNMFGAIGGAPNKIEARKRPLSSMSPTIVFHPEDTNKAMMALGSPWGTRIITCVTLSILNRLEYEMSPEETQLAVRYHHQWQPDRIIHETPGLDPASLQQLQDLGYETEERKFGCSIQLVERNADGVIAASDPRGQGRAIAR